MVIKTTITRTGGGLDALTKGLENAKSLQGNHAAICPKCGSTQMSYDIDGGDDAPVTCECGHAMGTKAEVAAQIKDRIMKHTGDGFRR